ncbi:MAG: DUF72 domain-containing protein [Spirochaetota bacterium]
MIFIGTSGFTYKHWKNRFYPEEIPAKKWLEYYTLYFNTVELNATFYRIPKSTTAENWRERTPPGFRFSVKLSRLITHVHRFENCAEIIQWFFRELEPLNEKIRVYLVQFPPSFICSEEKMKNVIALLPSDCAYAFEFRNKTGYEKSIIDLLADYNIGFCIHDFPHCESPEIVTSDFAYLRFHGYRSRYAGSYPDAFLAGWADKINSWVKAGKDILAYFNNDADASAIANASTLKKLTGS